MRVAPTQHKDGWSGNRMLVSRGFWSKSHISSPQCHQQRSNFLVLLLNVSLRDQSYVSLGEPSRCRGFLLQCRLYFASLEQLYDELKIAHITGLLTKKSAYVGHCDLWERKEERTFWTMIDSSPFLLSIWSCTREKEDRQKVVRDKPRITTGSGICLWIPHTCPRYICTCGHSWRIQGLLRSAQ